MSSEVIIYCIGYSYCGNMETARVAVEQLMEDICHRLRITSNKEFSLARNTEVLESKGTMRSSKAKEMNQIRKKPSQW